MVSPNQITIIPILFKKGKVPDITQDDTIYNIRGKNASLERFFPLMPTSVSLKPTCKNAYISVFTKTLKKVESVRINKILYFILIYFFTMEEKN
jgi:hypothetical protein